MYVPNHTMARLVNLQDRETDRQTCTSIHFVHYIFQQQPTPTYPSPLHLKILKEVAELFGTEAVTGKLTAIRALILQRLEHAHHFMLSCKQEAQRNKNGWTAVRYFKMASNIVNYIHITRSVIRE